MRFVLRSAAIVAALWASALGVSQGDKEPPVSLEQLLAWTSAPEAEHPSEEIAAALRRLGAGFRLTDAGEAQIRAGAASAQRPEDLLRQILQAAKENWIFDRLRLLVGKKEELPQIAAMVRERGVQVPYSAENEKALLDAGADEPSLTLLWPPLAPAKPKFPYQDWLIPKQNVEAAPLEFDPNQVRGEVEIEAIVDGRVMFVLKHDSIFYNVICGADLQITRAHFNAPLPRLPEERWEYRLDLSRKKPRGKAFACPKDEACAEADIDKKRNQRELLCRWSDLEPGSDEHGYSNARFVIDDPQSGAAAYTVVFQWAIKPYTLDWFVDDVKRLGTQRMQQRAYDWGISFGNEESTKSALREAGFRGDDPYERMGLGRVYRRTNLLTVKVH